MEIDSKRIARNTLFMYFRYILILCVTFYVSRVVLDRLGADDYGLYNVIFGIIGFLSFLNGTLSSSTSRFITFELGRGDTDRLDITFKTTLTAHVVLALVILLIGETAGLWYAIKIMVVPPERFVAAMIVYQISILSAVVSIVQVPFTAEIMAHERMDAYAYIGVFDAFARLLVAFLLTYSTVDNLILYAVLLFLVVLSVFVAYVIYSCRNFSESKLSFAYDGSILRSVLKFSGWNVLANLSQTFSVQGVILLFNLFFAPVVAAAQAIANQISTGVFSLASNVTAAINPQVIKLYADGKYDDSRKLTYVSAELVFFLLMVLCIPCIMVMPFLLDLWLVDIPDYTIDFARLILLQLIFESFNNVFYTPLLAANKIALHSVLGFFICFLQFIVLYLLFKGGCTPLWARYSGVLVTLIIGMIIKPIIMSKYIGFSLFKLYGCISKCILSLIIALALNYSLTLVIHPDSLGNNLSLLVVSVVITVLVALFFIGSPVRKKLFSMVHSFVNRKEK